MCVVRCVNSERNIKGEGTPVGFPDKFLSFPSAVAATLERALSALLAQCLFRAVHSLLLPNDTMAASDFTSRQTEALLASAQAFASLSFLGSLFIIFCWCRYHHLRKLSFTLVLWLAVADIGERSGGLISSNVLLLLAVMLLLGDMLGFSLMVRLLIYSYNVSKSLIERRDPRGLRYNTVNCNLQRSLIEVIACWLRSKTKECL